MTQHLLDAVFTVVTVTLEPKPYVKIFFKFTETCFKYNVSWQGIPYLFADLKLQDFLFHIWLYYAF